jgi:hypothetical protein
MGEAGFRLHEGKTIPIEGVNTRFPIEKCPEPKKVYSSPTDDQPQYTTSNRVTFKFLCGRGTLTARLDISIVSPLFTFLAVPFETFEERILTFSKITELAHPKSLRRSLF